MPLCCTIRSLRRAASLFCALNFSLGLTALPGRAPAQVAAVPQLMNFQGRLTKPDGTPVANGNYAIRFSLWSAASGGTELWNQTLNSVAVRNGTFGVLLSGFPASAFNNNTWLEIKVGADAALTPRQQLVSVAYAFKANSVADGSITTNALANNAVTGSKIANGAITSDKLATNALGWLLSGNAGTNPATQFLGTTDDQPLVFRTNNAERMRLTGTGRLFLGRTTGIGAGRLVISEDTSGYTGMYADSGTNGLPFYGYSQNGSSSTWTYLDGSDGNKWKLFHNGDKIAVTPTGEVGIGINAPTQRLDVNGNIRVRGADIALNGRGGGFGNSGGAGRALVDDGTGATTGGGLIINYANDFGKVKVDSSLEVAGLLWVLAGGVRFPDGTIQSTAAVSGGSGWSLTGNAGTNPANNFIGTTDAQPLVGRVNNSRALYTQYVTAPDGGFRYDAINIVNGFFQNTVAPGVVGATIAGGGNRYTNTSNNAFTDSINQVTDHFGTIAGGSGNRAGDADTILGNGRWATVGGGVNNIAGTRFATVGGGNQNTASGVNSTVAGGWLNTASALDSTVIGGQGNIASGDKSVVLGGTQNRASGPYSLAAGYFAEAAHFGAFVWGDFSSSNYVSSSADNQFTVRAAGGTRFFSNAALTAGVSLAPGAGSWSSVSDRNAKANVHPVDLDELLNKLLQVPIATWNYKSQAPSIRHIGPMAQDFYAVFGFGEDEKLISTIDADGVALAAIQGLTHKVKTLEAANETLKAKNAELEARLNAIERALHKLKINNR